MASGSARTATHRVARRMTGEGWMEWWQLDCEMREGRHAWVGGWGGLMVVVSEVVESSG